jgi:hypothetical protein
MTTETRYDVSPLGTKKNWVTERGGLPDFIRAIAHALIRSGHDESGAIQLAIGAVQNWARGGGHVTEKTRAKAADALAQWEAMKASTGRAEPTKLGFRASGSFAAGHPFEGNQWGPGNQPANQQDVNNSLGTTDAQSFILASAYQKAMNQTVTGKFTVSQLAGVQAALGAGAAKAAAGGAAKAAAAVKANAAKAAAAQKAAAAAAKKAQTAQTTASNKATAASKKSAQTALTASSAATAGSSAKAIKINALPADQRQALSTGAAPAGYTWGKGADGSPTLTQVTAQNMSSAQKATASHAVASATPASKASIAKANTINALPASQRQLMSTTSPPAGHQWVDGGSKGWSLALVTPASSTSTSTSASTSSSSPSTSSSGSPSTPAPSTSAAPAASTSSAAAPSPTVTAAQVAASAAAQMPVTKSSQAMANAINKLPAPARAQYAAKKPPAGFTWGKDQFGAPTLTLTKREDQELFIPLEQIEAEALRLRDMIGESTPDNAGSLLPVGPDKKEDAAIAGVLKTHRFVGSDLASCEQCGKPITAAVHRSTSGKRHAGPLGHEHVPTGHVKGNYRRHLQAAKSQSTTDQRKIEPGMEAMVKDHFAKQRQAVISRLTGKRGKTMLKRAAQAGGPVPPVGSVSAVGGLTGVNPANADVLAGATAAAVDPGAVFDATFWQNALEKALAQHYALAAEVAGGRVRSQVNAPVSLDDGDSLHHVTEILAVRAQRQAAGITETTRQAIYAAIQKGVVEGEGATELAGHINDIFDTADSVRAAMIARTETVGSLNQAAQAYAAKLPDGTVGSHAWLSLHDDRVRPTHAIADGQTVPVSRPFYVGGWPMLFPGDPAAPPDEVINCRCSQAFLPPDMSMGQGVLSATNLSGLIPASSLKALVAIQTQQAANRKALVGATADAAHGK